MKIEIKGRFSGKVLFEHEAENNTIQTTLEAAVTVRANLDGANLDGANLDGAYLYGANLARANLDGANLDGAYLYGAYLYGANLDGAYLDGELLKSAPLSILNLKWSVLISAEFMRIGCRRYSHGDWQNFDDAAINAMDSGALEFWREWKESLMMICEKHRKQSEKC